MTFGLKFGCCQLGQIVYNSGNPTPLGEGISENNMDDVTKQTVKQRLASAAGHIRGIERMVEDDTYCIDVIKQVQAVQAALNKVTSIILDNHLHTCVTTAIRDDEPDERERVLQEITSVFTMSNKI
jgi:CsoR family transcriptional regulator, copper-sensing transcriptional repressor